MLKLDVGKPSSPPVDEESGLGDGDVDPALQHLPPAGHGEGDEVAVSRAYLDEVVGILPLDAVVHFLQVVGTVQDGGDLSAIVCGYAGNARGHTAFLHSKHDAFPNDRSGRREPVTCFFSNMGM